MKRLFIFIAGMMLSAAAGMVVHTFAFSTSFPNDEDLLQQLFEEAGIDKYAKKDAKELENLAAEKDAPFNNLYLFMVQNAMEGPQEAALTAIAKRTRYTKEQLQAIVLEGNIDIIVSKKEEDLSTVGSEEKAVAHAEDQAQADENMASFLGANDFSESTQSFLQWKYRDQIRPPDLSAADLSQTLTQTGIINEYLAIKNMYDRELEFQRKNRKLNYQALASEIFMNGDLSDSADIDLLYDLDRIHYILFGETITYPDRSMGGELALSSDESDVELQALELPEVEQASMDQEIKLAEEVTYACLEDADLRAALETFEDHGGNEGVGGHYEEEESARADIVFPETEDAESTESTESGVSDSGLDNAEESDFWDQMRDLTDFLETVEGEIGDWSRSLPCNEVFCIKVEVISEQYGTEKRNLGTMKDFKETDDCIACHTAFLQKRMEETTSRSLVPSKITMNWFEDATCKEAGNFINFDLNVYAIKRSIDLDPGDDLDEQAGKEVEELKRTLVDAIGFPWPGGSRHITDKTVADVECESLITMHKIADANASLEEIRKLCDEAQTEQKNRKAEIYEEFDFEAYSRHSSDLYSAVSAELYSFMLYFKQFQEALQETYLADRAPLPSLLSKEYCPQ